MSNFWVLQLNDVVLALSGTKRCRFGCHNSFFFFFLNSRAVQNNVILDCGNSKRRRFETVLNHLSKMTSFG